MNAINWKAVGIGAAVSIGGSLLLGVLFRIFPYDASERPLWMFLVLSYGAAAVLDIAGGATAGWLARVRGAAHGALAGLIANLLSPFIGFAMMWVETRGEVPIDFVTYAMAIATGALVGVVLSAAAGAVAAKLARAQPA